MDLYGTTTADKSALDALIGEVTGLDQNAYTESSWAALSEALAAAQTVSGDRSATTDEVTKAYNNLASARDGLVEVDPGTDPTPEDPRAELAALISKMSGVTNDNYTEGSWNAFQAKLQEALGMDLNTATDEEVQAMINTLQAAYDGLAKDSRNALK